MQKHWSIKIVSILVIVMLALMAVPVTSVFAAGTTITSTTTGGLWNSGTTWVDGVVPTSADSVVIATGANVILDVAPVISGSLTINGGATLTTNNYALKLGDNFTNNGMFIAGSSNIDITGFIPQNIASFTTTGTVSMTKSGDTATFTGNVSAGALIINGSGGTPGTLNLGTGLTHTFSGTWTNTTGTLDGCSSTLNISGAASITGGTFTGNSGTLKLNGAVTKTGGTFTPGTTVNYSGTAQTVVPATYNNLTLSSSGAKTTTGVTVNGVLSMEGTATVTGTLPTYGVAATLQYNTATNKNAGTEWITPFAATGGVIIANTGAITMNGAKTFNAGVPLTINSGATLITNNAALTLGGNFTNNGTFTAGNSAITITNTAPTQSIAGFTTTGTVSMTKVAGTATFTGNVNAGPLTINGSGGTLNLGAGLTHTFGTWTNTIGTLEGGSSTLTISGAVSIAGGTFTGNSSTLNLNGAVTKTGGTFTPGTTVNYGGGLQTVVPVIYNNLTLSGSAAKTLTGLSTINGNLTLGGTASATLAATLTIGGNLTIGTSTTLASAANILNLGGNWANSGTFAQGTGTVTLQGISDQTISGAATTFYKLTINKVSGGVTLSTNATVNNALTLTSGIVTTGAFSLIVGTAGTAAGANAASYIFGNLQKNFATGAQSFTFDIGDATYYAPVAVAFANVSIAGNVTATTTAGEHPNIATIVGLDSTKDVNRYWTLAGGLVFTTYSATFNFVPGDIDSGATTSNFIVKRYSSGWFFTTTGSQLPTSTQATGMTAMSDFVVGELDNTAPTVTNVSSTNADGSYKAGDLIVVTVTFSEAVNVTGTPTLQLETGIIDQTVNYASGSGTSILTFNYTVQAGDTSSDLDYVATNSLAGTIKDSANNDTTSTLPSPGALGSLGSTKTIEIDTTAPDTTITGQPANPDNDSTPTFTFSGNDGTGSGVASFMCKMDGSSYATCTSAFTSSALLDGSHTFYVKAIDKAANEDTTPAFYTWTLDTIAPTVSMSSAATNPTNALPIPVTVTFSESVTDFTSGDITPGNGTVSSFAGSGASYSFNLTPSANGLVTADIAASVAQDSAGNNNTAATQFSRVYDGTAPTVSSIVRVNPNPTSSVTVNFTVTFSESVTDVDTADFSLTTTGVSGASVTGVSGSGSTRTVTVNTGSGNGTIRLDVPGSATITDLVGNPLASLPYTSGEFYTVSKTYQIFLPLVIRN